MKRRNLNYLRRVRALRAIENPREVSLKSLLASARELCSNNVVKRHIESTLRDLQSSRWQAA